MYHVILNDNQKSYIPTSGKIKVYTFLDGTTHVLFEDKWYDIKSIKDYQLEVKNVIRKKSQEEINLSKSHKPTNSPWRKGLPHVVSHKSMHYAVTHGC